jgi:hypothetical protein
MEKMVLAMPQRLLLSGAHQQSDHGEFLIQYGAREFLRRMPLAIEPKTVKSSTLFLRTGIQFIDDWMTSAVVASSKSDCFHIALFENSAGICSLRLKSKGSSLSTCQILFSWLWIRLEQSNFGLTKPDFRD